MTTVKIQGKPRAAAQGPLEARADWLYTHPGGRVIGVVELVHTEVSTPAPDTEKDRSVTVAISTLEIASPDQEEVLRKAARAIYVARTAQGTLDVDGELEMSQSTLRLLTGELYERRAAELEAQIRYWAEQAHRAFTAPNLSDAELRHELNAVADGLYRAAAGIRSKDDD